MEKLAGFCLCRKVRYTVAGKVRNLCYCHCDSCRRATGAPCVAWGTVNVDDFQVAAGKMAVVESSPGVTRGFCAACGTSLTYAHEKRDGDIDFTLATLEQPELLKPRMHIWVEDRLPWVNIGDGLPCFQTVPNAEM